MNTGVWPDHLEEMSESEVVSSVARCGYLREPGKSGESAERE